MTRVTDEEITRSIQRIRDVGATVQMKSQAMRPLAWLILILTPSLGLMIAFGPDWVKYFASVVLVAGIVTYIWAYRYWMKNDPDRLGSEAFIVQRDVLAYAQQTKSAYQALDVTPSTDPFPPKLPEKGKP